MSAQSPDGPAGRPVQDVRVVLYGRAGCHLCDEARALVERVCAETGTSWTEVDVDTADGSADLVARYGDLVPVLLVDGVQQGFWRVDEARLRRAVGAA